MRITCPHCGEPARIRTSREISSFTREAYAQCNNIDCCHVFKVLVEAVATVSPPRNPDPAVRLEQTNPPEEQS
jgi:hypothetical protein